MALTEEKIQEIKEQFEGLSPEEQKAKLQEILASLPPEDREQLMGGQQQCPFCLMVQGQIPVKKVYEDDICLAILDINPANKGHILLFPKTHYQLLAQADDNEVAHLFKIANKLSTAVFEAVEAQGTNILVANGPVAGQTSPHVLINIIPRFEKDKVSIGWQPQKIDEKEMEDIAKDIAVKASSIRAKPDVIVQAAPKDEEKPREIKRIP